MKLTEKQYGELWMRHRRLELETQIAKRAGAGHKTVGTQLMKAAVLNEMKCGRWLTIGDVANRLQVKNEVAERHLRELRKEGRVQVEFHHQTASYKIKKGL
jgi:ribosomal protein S25